MPPIVSGTLHGFEEVRNSHEVRIEDHLCFAPQVVNMGVENAFLPDQAVPQAGASAKVNTLAMIECAGVLVGVFDSAATNSYCLIFFR